MPSQKNIQSLEELNQKLDRSKTVVLADFKGLTVDKFTELRNQLKEIGGEIKVYKNTLLKLAFKEKDLQLEEADKNFDGPSAAVFAYDDEIAPVKKVYEFTLQNQLPKFKFGFLNKEFIDSGRITQLGGLPGKEILLAQVVGSLNAPISGFVNVLQGNLRKLVLVLKAVEEKKN